MPYEPTWLDKGFRKEYESLTQTDKDRCSSLLGDFLADLKSCRHPLRDPILQKWRPSSYRGVVKVTGGHLAEYRLGSTMRAIVCYFKERDELLLVTVTLKHDHERMKRLLREHGRHLPSYL